MARPAHFSPFPLSLSLFPPRVPTPPLSLPFIRPYISLSLSLTPKHLSGEAKRREARWPRAPATTRRGPIRSRPRSCPTCSPSSRRSAAAAGRGGGRRRGPGTGGGGVLRRCSVADEGPAKPAVLLTCAGGIRAPGLAALVDPSSPAADATSTYARPNRMRPPILDSSLRYSL